MPARQAGTLLEKDRRNRSSWFSCSGWRCCLIISSTSCSGRRRYLLHLRRCFIGMFCACQCTDLRPVHRRLEPGTERQRNPGELRAFAALFWCPAVALSRRIDRVLYQRFQTIRISILNITKTMCYISKRHRNRPPSRNPRNRILRCSKIRCSLSNAGVMSMQYHLLIVCIAIMRCNMTRYQEIEI